MITIQEQRFLDSITKAANQIEPTYFNVPISYGKGLLIRERVFCYELYYQIKLIIKTENILPPGMEFHGEIDKNGNSFFDKQNPDFVLHVPGTNEYNTLVMEVKGKLDSHSTSGIKKDFKTLHAFVNSYGYKIGVFFIYNHSIEALMARNKSHIELIVQDEESQHKIFIISVPTFGQGLEAVSLYELFN